MRPSQDEHADGRCDGRAQVVAQAIIADAFGSAAGRQYIDGYGAVGYGSGSHRCAMNGAKDAEREQAACHEIAAEEDGKESVADQQHELSGKGVDKVAAKGTDEQCGQGVAAQD